MEQNKKLSRRAWSFIGGGAFLAVFVALAISVPLYWMELIGIGVLGYFLISCLILPDNIIEDVVLSVLNWSFISLPMLIFTLDLDGIIWLITVKFLFWLLGIVLGIICAILAFFIGGFLSIFVYPYALYKSYHPEVVS